MIRRTVLALVALVALAGAGSPASASELVDGIAAQVGGDIVLVSEVLQLSVPVEEQVLEAGGSASDVAALRQDVLDRLIERRLIEQVVRRAELEASDADVDQAIQAIAAEHGLSVDQLRATVEDQGMSFEGYRERIRGEIQSSRVIGAMVTSRVHVDESDVRQLYAQRYQDQPTGGTQVHVRHLLVTFGDQIGRSESEACARVRTAAARIEAGADFATLAGEMSELNPERGGDLGWLHVESLAGWMRPEVAKLSDGEVSDVIRTDFGCNMLMLVERREFEPVSYGQAREALNEELFTQRTEAKYREWMEELRDQTYIARKGLLDQVPVDAVTVRGAPSPPPAGEVPVLNGR